MADLRMTTTSGTDTLLDEATVQGLKTSVRGPLLRPGDVGYDEARTVWNGTIGRARIKAGYGANYERLVALKNKYDPLNLFRHNQNIPPTV